MKKLHIALIGALFATLVVVSTSTVLAQCPEDDPDCPLEPPQSEQINTDPINAEGSSSEVDDPGALEPVESELQGDGPTIIDPEPFAQSGVTPPDFEKIPIRVRWQEPTDVSCGVQALGMAFDGLGGGSPTSSAILDNLQSKDMMYDFGTGVEELAYAAQNFGYKGTIPFHNWSLSDLQAELSEGRTPVVAIGSNGAGQPGHFVTVTGISPDGKWVSYNDPTLGEQTITVEEFNRLWGLQGNSGVAVRKTVPVGDADLVPWVAFAATLMAVISQTPLALRRMGIGGRLITGAGSTSRKKISPKRSTAVASLGGVPSRAAKALSRLKQRAVRPKKTRSTSPPRDPSPQMYNQALVPARKTEKLVWKRLEPEPIGAVVPEFTVDPGGWFKAQWDNHIKPIANAATDFTTGMVYQALRNTLEPAGLVAMALIPPAREGIPEAVKNIEKYTLPDTTATRLGRIAGSLGSLFVSGVVFLMGGAEIGGGVAACGTGVLCWAGAPAITAGSLEMLAAGSVAVTSTKAIVEQLAALSAKPGKGSRGGWERIETEYGDTVEVRRLSDREVKQMGLHEEKLEQQYHGRDTIYIDKSGNTWIQGQHGGPLIDFP